MARTASQSAVRMGTTTKPSKALTLGVNDERRRKARCRRITARAGRRHVAGAPGYLTKKRLRLHIYLHLFEFEMPVVHQREHRARRLHPLLHHIRRAKRLADGPRPRAFIVLIADEA